MAPDRARRRRLACKECRYQKIKCDAEPPRSCSRCHRMSLTCTIAAATPGARQTKAQLQRELEAMRERGSSRAAEEVGAVSVVSPSPDDGDQSMPADLSVPVLLAPVAPISGISSAAPVVSVPELLPPSSAAATGLGDTFLSTPTVYEAASSAQTLDGQKISGRKIRDCFTLFFTSYAPFLPILDANIIPDECFRQSPFLLWTIVYIGSRRYARDPTLLSRLAPRINAMALLALEQSRSSSSNSPMQTIQGILLLCTWPIPANTMYRDMSLVLGGAAMHLAMQIGLHVAGVGQDFSRTMIEGDRRAESAYYRARVWRQCCMVCHTTALREGIMPLGLRDTTSVSAQDSRAESEASQDPSRFRHRAQDIMMSATTAFQRVNLSSRGRQHRDNAALLSCISLFDAQLLDLAPQAQTAIDSIYLQCYQVHVLAYHFLVDAPHRRFEGLLRLYSTACAILRSVCGATAAPQDTSARPRNNDNSTGIDPSLLGRCPVFVQRSLMLACMSILKVQRSPELAPHLLPDGGAAGEEAYFGAIVATRSLSLQNDDLCARGATILTQLWNSRDIFKSKASGGGDEVEEEIRGDSLGCRVRSRLSMSVVFDCLWWWRQEFGGQGNPYSAEQSQVQTRRPSPAGVGRDETASQRHISEENRGGVAWEAQDGDEESSFFTEEPFTDFDWATTLNLNEWL